MRVSFKRLREALEFIEEHGYCYPIKVAADVADYERVGHIATNHAHFKTVWREQKEIAGRNGTVSLISLNPAIE